YNSDGLPDIAASRYTAGEVRLLVADRLVSLVEDPSGSGLRSGYARGNLWGNSTDTDWYVFSANAGDVAVIASETPGSPVNSALEYDLYDGFGNQQSYTVGYNNASGYNGSGQSNPATLAGGTYYLRVVTYQNYQSEYRLRVSLAATGIQAETDGNW